MPILPIVVLSLCLAPLAPARVLEVRGDDELRRSLPGLKAGDTLRIAPGAYRGGHHIANLHGTAKAPVIIEGTRDARPRFEGGKSGFHFSNCTHLILRDLEISGQQINGLNIDDGGDDDSPAHHVTIERVHVSRIGPRGNHDAIKLSGVDDFVVRECEISGWAGQAIDMVGCHRGTIEHCTFKGVDGFSQTTGPQTKGGSENIVIRRCTFLHAGGRPLQLGGSTGKPYFRPKGARFEARNIVAHDNLIVGGQCAVAFAGLDGGEFHHNTILDPEKWVLRILQENNEAGIAPCRNVTFHHNLIVYRRSKVGIAANIGANTEPASFVFDHNAWFASDSPGRSEPKLPSRPRSAVTGKDPRLDRNTGHPSAAWAMPYGRRPR